MPAPNNPPRVTTTSGTNPGMLGDWYQNYLEGAPPASTYNPTTAATTDWNVGKKQTVQGQVANIIDADSPLMQQASTRALQQSNGRGLLNSSLGVQAGQAALYDAALPMAQQDASTYADAARTNAGEANTTARFNADAGNTAGQFNADARNTRNTGMFDAAVGLYGDREQRAFERRENAAERTFTSSENSAQRSWQTGERRAGQNFDAGESALNRAWQSGERVNAQTFTAAQATLDRDQQTTMQRLQERGMDKRQATDIAARERMLAAQQTFDSETLANEQAFILTKDATDFEQDLKLLDQQNGTALAGQYRNAMGSAVADYQARVNEIQTSDMDEDVKQAQIASLGTLFQQKQQFLNTLFESAEDWGADWATVSGEFIDEEEGG